jgi:hypothetical protein
MVLAEGRVFSPAKAKEAAWLALGVCLRHEPCAGCWLLAGLVAGRAGLSIHGHGTP